MDPSTHHLTTSMSPGQLAMVAPEHHSQSSYAMPLQQSYHPVTPYMPAYSHPQPMPISPTNSRKRRLSDDAGPSSMPLMSAASVNDTLYSKSQEQDLMRHFELDPSLPQQHPDADHIPQPPPSKKSRVNTPWTPAEEQRLKVLRDQGQSWSEIAKVHMVDSSHVLGLSLTSLEVISKSYRGQREEALVQGESLPTCAGLVSSMLMGSAGYALCGVCTK